MIKHFLSFEKQISDLEGKIEELRHLSSGKAKIDEEADFELRLVVLLTNYTKSKKKQISDAKFSPNKFCSASKNETLGIV